MQLTWQTGFGSYSFYSYTLNAHWLFENIIFNYLLYSITSMVKLLSFSITSSIRPTSSQTIIIGFFLMPKSFKLLQHQFQNKTLFIANRPLRKQSWSSSARNRSNRSFWRAKQREYRNWHRNKRKVLKTKTTTQRYTPPKNQRNLNSWRTATSFPTSLD